MKIRRSSISQHSFHGGDPSRWSPASVTMCPLRAGIGGDAALRETGWADRRCGSRSPHATLGPAACPQNTCLYATRCRWDAEPRNASVPFGDARTCATK